MTVEELKSALLGKQYATPIRIDVHEVVSENAELFLKTSFRECDKWKKDISKCPSYLRLIKFYKATR